MRALTPRDPRWLFSSLPLRFFLVYNPPFLHLSPFSFTTGARFRVDYEERVGSP